MMRSIMTGVALVVMSGMAMAADLPSKTAPAQFEAPPPIPVFNWTGFYVGAQAGYGFGRDSAALRRPAATAFYGYNPHGIVGGFHAGYNYQLPAIAPETKVVLGVVADVDGADYKSGGYPFGGILAGTTATTQSDIKGSVRGRVGVGVNRVLFYATGGAAFANFDTRYSSASAFGAGAVSTHDRTRTGYTVGGGIEYAFLNYVSVRAEYRYTNYGTFTDALGGAAPGLNAAVAHRETDNRVQAGISYKFESIVPSVTARY